MSGILITTDKNKEKYCVRDAYNILNDAVEYLYPDLMKKADFEENNCDKISKKQKISDTEFQITKTGHVSDLLENELKKLRENKAKLFFNFETNCKGVVFIKVDKEYRDRLNLKEIVNHIIENIKIKKEQVSKNIARFVPVDLAFKAKFELFQKNIPEIINNYFQKYKNDSEFKEKITWKLEMKVRNNNSVHKDEYLEFLLSLMDKEIFHVDYKNSKYVILVEVTNDLLCFSILENYNENKSYNLLTLSKSDEELKLERERLMNKQREREEEKKKLVEINLQPIEETLEINKSGETNDQIKLESDSQGESDIELI